MVTSDEQNLAMRLEAFGWTVRSSQQVLVPHAALRKSRSPPPGGAQDHQKSVNNPSPDQGTRANRVFRVGLKSPRR